MAFFLWGGEGGGEGIDVCLFVGGRGSRHCIPDALSINIHCHYPTTPLTSSSHTYVMLVHL